jgi:hypothetical protein
MEHNDRNGRDAAGVGPYARERESLTPLSTLDWTVSEGEPDIRGWEVRTVSGRQLGSVADLLVDEKAGEVVLLDVDLPGSDRHTFVPIRVAQIDRGRRVVLMDSADLPDSAVTRDVVREADRSAGRRADDGASTRATVRYPRAEREVIGERAPLADAPRLADGSRLADAPPVGDEPVIERRRGDRRRIDRISTDL